MRLALFTDTFLPQTNGVARTLGRLTGHLHRRGIEHLLFTPNPPRRAATLILSDPWPASPFSSIPSAGWPCPACPPCRVN
ncbi:hypothetical protein [Paenibacillus rhizoplanae]|uniref:hypothetical protein n=1 Tax=Paenibacillus rhizoplanae TaxID=1917181 RepID=UPI003615749A